MLQWHDLFVALALVLVLEGLLPFASPSGWRRVMLQAAQLNDSQLRTVGLASMCAGVLGLYAAHAWA